MPTWLPKRIGDRLIWLGNAEGKIGVHVGTAGIVAADQTFLTRALAAFSWTVARSENLKTATEQMNQYKTILMDGPGIAPMGAFPAAPTFPAAPANVMDSDIFGQIVALMERIRNTVGFTEEIGQDLGIMGPGTTPELGDPEFVLIALPNSEIRIEWVKGISSGVLVESQRAGETTWTLLGTDTNSPYIDGRDALAAGQPEVRRYRLRYLDGDDPVGNYSAVQTITTVP